MAATVARRPFVELYSKAEEEAINNFNREAEILKMCCRSL